MWVIRLLTGSKAGQTIALQPGKTRIGRDPNCQITISENGVSKVHAEITVMPDKVMITDLGSSNGTFVNGVKIQSQVVSPTDKISLHNILFDVQPVSPAIYQAHQFSAPPPAMAQAQAQPMQNPAMAAPAQNFQDMNYGADMGAPGMGAPGEEVSGDQPQPEKAKQSLKERLLTYIDEVALPGVYKLAELSEFRWVLGGFVLIYIVVVTILSTIPMITITKSSIELESQRRALTIARNLAKLNEAALLQDLPSAVSVETAQLEEGVKRALVVSNVDGHIIAPVNRLGTYPERSFVHAARQRGKEFIKQLSSDQVGAAVPIAFYNPSLSQNQVKAWAIVVYDMGTLAIDDGRTISLFVQTLTMALIIGGILFFFMYKLIEYPIRNINQQIDEALKSSGESVATNFQFPVLHELCANISSALSRASGGGDHGSQSSALLADRDLEADNLLKIIPCPAMAISASDRTVISVNGIFESEIGVSLMELKQQGIDAIPDQAFQLNLADLVEQVQQQPDLVASNTLEFSGVDCELLAQAIHGNTGPVYMLITIQPVSDYDEGVA